MTWRVDGEVLDGGAVGGDAQAGTAWSVRLRLVEEPDDGLFGVVDEYWFPERMDDGSFGVTNMTQFCICTDPDDPGGTELYADVEYDAGSGDVLIYSEVERAEAACKRYAENADPSTILWDGRTHIYI